MIIDNQKYYTCKYDRAFKEVMLKEQNKNILQSLLELILKVKINEIDIRNIERNSGNLHLKRKYFDCLLKTDVGNIGIEINSNALEEYVRPRNMAYISDMYASHTLIGKEYNEETNIIQINLSYNLKNKRKQEEYYIQNELEERYVNNFKIIEINMELYKEMWYSNNIKEIEENKYLVMLDLEKEELEKLSEKDKVVSQYMEELDRVNEDLEFRQFMSHEEDERKIFNSRMRAAEEKGLEDGIKQGMKEGIEKGKLDLVKEALKLEIDIDIISKMSKMPIEEIKNIKNNLN